MKAQTKNEAVKIKNKLIAEGKSNISIYKFTNKRKFQFLWVIGGIGWSK